VPLDEFNKGELCAIKPFIDLYTDFILRYYKEEYEASKQLSTLTDLTMPHEWFPMARLKQRVIHYHMGPTNSGKTKSALERLKAAKNGIYCAPLRLLAWEVSEVLLNNGIGCSLVTG
jgi:ATP-dependent RNA helicase SUPV3L1/SUV3